MERGAAHTAQPGAEHLLIRSNEDLLEEESRAGFLSVMPAGAMVSGVILPKNGEGKIIVLPAVQNLSREYIQDLRNAMEAGAWVIWEQRASFDSERARDTHELLNSALGIIVRRCLRVELEIYVHYRWPVVAMVRAFQEVALLDCSPQEAAAEYGGAPAAIRRPYGHGGLVFVGSMIGPGIRAGEPQAWQVGRRLFGLSDL